MTAFISSRIILFGITINYDEELKWFNPRQTRIRGKVRNDVTKQLMEFYILPWYKPQTGAKFMNPLTKILVNNFYLIVYLILGNYNMINIVKSKIDLPNIYQLLL